MGFDRGSWRGGEASGPGLGLGWRGRAPLWLAIALAGGGSCARLARCEMDKVRAEVLAYDRQIRDMAPLERRWKRHVAEFDGKIFTNQKAGVDLLRAVLVAETREILAALEAVRVRSRLIRPLHAARVRAVRRLLGAYERLMRAYPAEDFKAIRAGLADRESAWRSLQRAELEISHLVQKYRSRRR